MTIYERAKEYLEHEPRARERKNRYNAIRMMLIGKYPALKEVDRETLIRALRTAETYNRAIRQVQEKHAELRGEDYGDKDELEDLKQEELGYRTP